MAGGLDLIDRLKSAAPLDRLVALAGISDLQAITMQGETLSIGAAATHRALIASPVVATHLPDLATIWRRVANPRVRAVGTIGGNLMAGQRHYDAAPAFLALGARSFDHDAGRRDPERCAARRAAPEPISCCSRSACRRPRARHWSPSEAYTRSSLSIARARATTARCALQSGAPTIAPARSQCRPAPWQPTSSRPLAALPPPIDDDVGSSVYRRRMIGVLACRLAAQL